MATSFNGVSDVTLQKFIDKLATCIRFNSGVAPAAAPNAIKDRLGKIVSDQSKDVTVTLRVVNGNTAYIKIVPNDGNPGYGLEGTCDVATLAAVLA